MSKLLFCTSGGAFDLHGYHGAWCEPDRTSAGSVVQPLGGGCFDLRHRYWWDTSTVVMVGR